MRAKLLFLLVLAMLVGLVYLVGTRTRDPHVMPRPRAAESAEASAPRTAPSASSTLAPMPRDVVDASAPETGAPLLDRPLRVVAHSWELAAALVVANGGRSTADGSLVGARGLVVHVDIVPALRDIENQLARGGADPAGADVAALPLPWLAASYERIHALEPRVVHVLGWSHGREVLLGSKEGLLSRPGLLPNDVAVFTDDPAASALALFALESAGVSASHVRFVTDPKSASMAALARPLAADRSPELPSKVLVTTAEASRLIPFAAVVAGSFMRDHAAALAAALDAWDRGAIQLRADVPAAARGLASEPGAPEPSGLLERLGWISDPRDERALLPTSLEPDAGSSGDVEATVGVVFRQEWLSFRDVGIVTSPFPETSPIDLIANRASPPPAVSAPAAPPDASRVLLAQRVTKSDAAAVAARAAFLASVFERSTVRVTARPPVLAKDVADIATARDHVAPGRIVVGVTAPADPGALLEILSP